MNYLKHLKTIIVIAGFLGLLAACGEHGHEETIEGEKKKEHSHSHG